MAAPVTSFRGAFYLLLIARRRRHCGSHRYKAAAELASPTPGPVLTKTNDFSHSLGLWVNLRKEFLIPR